MLLRHQDAQLLLASRASRVSREGQGLNEQLTSLQQPDSRTWVAAADVGQLVDGCSLIQELSAAASPGVIHTAGVLRDAPLRNFTADGLDFVAAPKSRGAWNLHVLTARLRVDALALFSSVASAFGNIGQASYAAANAYLDVLARQRRASAIEGAALQVPLVIGAGMGATVSNSGVTLAISLEEYAICLQTLLMTSGCGMSNSVQLPLGPLVDPALESMYVFGELLGQAPIATLGGAHRVATLGGAQRISGCEPEIGALTGNFAQMLSLIPPTQRQTQTLQRVRDVVRDISARDESSSADAPLLESSMDSLAATELASQLAVLTEIKLSVASPPVL